MRPADLRDTPLPDLPLLATVRSATAEPEQRGAASRQRAPPFGVVGSLALHLLPFLWLLQWTQAPAPVPAIIPLRLVIEHPPPPPPPPAPKAAEQKPPPGRLASEEFGDVTAPPKTKAPEPMAPPQPTPAEPAAASPPPAAPAPRPERRPQRSVATRTAPRPHAAPRPARFPGPAATQDEYLAYCMALIRRYYDMLPASFLAGRRGRTVLSVEVLDDGTIARIAVKESSGFHDIDARIERMVAAVHRFPPLPQWIQTSSVTLNYVQSFPDGMAPR